MLNEITDLQRVEIKALEEELARKGKLTVNGVAYDLNELPVQIQYTAGKNSYMWVEKYPLPPYALSLLWYIQAIEKALVQFQEEAGRFGIKPTHYPELLSV